MRLLLLQLKRIGDLVLTTPAISALRRALPDTRIALAVDAGTAELLPAITGLDEVIVFGKGRGWTPWQQVLSGPWDGCLDFSGTDRSALAVRLSRAQVRATFQWVQRKRLRSLAFTRFIDSPVRERHTSDHYGDLLAVLEIAAEPSAPTLQVPAAAEASAGRMLAVNGVAKPYVLLHPFTARPEKNWEPSRWAEVIVHCWRRKLRCVITGGSSAEEFAHHAKIDLAWGDLSLIEGGVVPNPGAPARFEGKTTLLEQAALVQDAALVISTDTAVAHLAAAFQRPQITLFGPTNPFHWRPRHERAVAISAVQPDAPLSDFDPRMKGAPMERISADAVCRAMDTLLPSPL